MRKLLLIVILIGLSINCVKTHTEEISIGIIERVEYVPGSLGKPQATLIYGTKGSTTKFGYHTFDIIGDSAWVIREVIVKVPLKNFPIGAAFLHEQLKVKTAYGYKIYQMK